jgi:NAD(P)H-flavin reductase
MKPQRFRVQLQKRERLNTKFYLIAFTLIEPKTIEFHAGQYLSLQVAKDKRNSYSITSFPDRKNQLQICVDVSPQGQGTQFVKSAPLGTETEVLAPLGKFSLSQKGRPALFVATGSGISPFRPMIAEQLRQLPPVPVHLYWGLRYPGDVFWNQYWQDLASTWDQFQTTICVSRPSIYWKGTRGRVTEAIDKDYDALTDWEAYLCGNGIMIDDMVRLLTGKGMKPERIYTERFF